MKIYFAADHAGFELKNILVEFVRTLGYEVEDCGVSALDTNDDYPPIVIRAAKKVAQDIRNGIITRAIILGGSGEGEAMVANRLQGVRAAVFYGPPSPQLRQGFNGYSKATDGQSAPVRLQRDISGHTIDVLTSSRAHNNANVLALGARFLNEDEAKDAVQKWLSAAFGGEERHTRRIKQIDELTGDVERIK